MNHSHKSAFEDQISFSISEIIYKAIKDAGITQKQLAEKCHMKHTTISQLINCRRMFKAHHLKAISDALGIEIQAEIQLKVVSSN